MTDAAAAGFTAEPVQAGSFTLQAFHKGLSPDAQRWHVYLEGDGLAFRGHYKLSSDPTPVDPVALHLALADPAAAVLYLARPCQYRAQGDERPCSSRYWSSHRFAEDVIQATVSAIGNVLEHRAHPDASITLIGYSGGGALAALIAARSSSVERLVTIAAPLDLAAWTRHHGVTPLDGSLDPLAIAHRLTMPQIHFAARQDTIAPPILQRTFLQGLPSSSAARSVVVDGAHRCCWQRTWRDLLKALPAVQR